MHPGAQIDLLIQRKDNVINVCEMKYTIGDYSISKDYELNLKNKMQCFYEEVHPKEQLVLTLITFNELKENEYSNIIVSKINVGQLFE